MSDTIRSADRVLNQKAVYWGVSGFDENARPIYHPPIEIRCRWTDSAEEYLDETGHVHISNAAVMVDRDLDVQGVLWQGKLSDITNEGKPFDNTGAYEIKKKKKVANKRATKFFRQVYL